MRPGFAFCYESKSWPKKRLRGRSARIVVTMGMPTLVYRWVFLAHSLRSLERNILRFVGIGPVRDTLIGLVEAMSPAKRERWLACADTWRARPSPSSVSAATALPSR